jgi:hypothetical protein
MCNISVAAKLRPIMVGNGVILLLVALMKEHNRTVEIQEHATGALYNFAMNNLPNRAIICRVGGIQAVVTNMQKGPEQLRLQHVCCLLLRCMSCDNESQSESVKAGAIATVVAAMRADKDTVKTMMAGVAFLSNLAMRSPERQQLILDVGGMDMVLLAMKLHPENVELRTYVCHFLHHFVRSTLHQEAVVSAGGIPALLQSMSAPTAGRAVQNLAVHVIVTLALASPAFDTLLKVEGAVPALTALFAQECLDVKNRKAAGEFLARHAACSHDRASALCI